MTKGLSENGTFGSISESMEITTKGRNSLFFNLTGQEIMVLDKGKIECPIISR